MHPVLLRPAVLGWLACTLALSARAAPLDPPDWSAQRDPVTLRVALDAEQLAQARVHVPAGTRAYRIGDAAGDRLLAWYRAADGRLLAALHIATGAPHAPTRDGVRVHAGAGHQGRAGALVEVAAQRDVPALAAADTFSLQAHGAVEHAAAPLLSYRGSTHLVALAPAHDQRALRAARFDVRARDAQGAQTELLQLPLHGGSLPLLLKAAPTRPGVPTDLVATNAGSEPRLLEGQLAPPLRGTQPPLLAGSFAQVVPPGSSLRIGQMVSDAPGRFDVAYRDQPVVDVAQGPLEPRPLVRDAAGNARLDVVPATALASAQFQPQGTQPLPGEIALATAVGGSRQANRIAIAGAAAGLLAAWLVERDGREHRGTVAIVPLEEDELQRERSAVRIATIETSGLLLMEPPAQDKKPCECEKLSLKPAFDDDKLPEAKVAAEIGGSNDSLLTLTIDAKWLATIKCSAGDGDCRDSLALSASSSGWKIDGSDAAPVPKSERIVDPAPGKGGTSVACSGPCGAETPKLEVDTRYVIKLAHGKLQGDAGKEFGGLGKINARDKISGTVTLMLMPDKCGNDGWKMVLRIGGSAGEPRIEWPVSDRDGDGTPDAKDKNDDPAPKPKPPKKK